MRVIIAGGRDCNNYTLLLDTIVDFDQEIVIVVSGQAAGADQLGERYARENGIPIDSYPAQWELHGKAAGSIRNKLMAENADALSI